MGVVGKTHLRPPKTAHTATPLGRARNTGSLAFVALHRCGLPTVPRLSADLDALLGGVACGQLVGRGGLEAREADATFTFTEMGHLLEDRGDRSRQNFAEEGLPHGALVKQRKRAEQALHAAGALVGGVGKIALRRRAMGRVGCRTCWRGCRVSSTRDEGGSVRALGGCEAWRMDGWRQC